MLVLRWLICGVCVGYAYHNFERLGCGSFLPFLGSSSSGGQDLPWRLEVTDSVLRDEDSAVGRVLWLVRSTVQKHIDSVDVLLVMVLKKLVCFFIDVESASNFKLGTPVVILQNRDDASGGRSDRR